VNVCKNKKKFIFKISSSILVTYFYKVLLSKTVQGLQFLQIMHCAFTIWTTFKKYLVFLK